MERYALRDFSEASPEETEDAMERAEVVFYARCPVELPNAADLEFMRKALPRELQTKNISYHPESDSIPAPMARRTARVFYVSSSTSTPCATASGARKAASGQSWTATPSSGTRHAAESDA